PRSRRTLAELSLCGAPQRDHLVDRAELADVLVERHAFPAGPALVVAGHLADAAFRAPADGPLGRAPEYQLAIDGTGLGLVVLRHALPHRGTDPHLRCLRRRALGALAAGAAGRPPEGHLLVGRAS